MTRRVTAVAMLVVAVAYAPSCRRSGGKADGAAPASSPVVPAGVDGVPSPAELEAYVSGSGAVRLGMTETEVIAALGRPPSRRQDPVSGPNIDMAWDGLPGARPGAAVGRFYEGRLISLELAPAAQVYPRVDKAAAQSVTHPDFVRRSVARTLRMADIEAVTRVPGYRATWAISSGYGRPTSVLSRWMWEVEPGGKVLYVEEQDGLADQPVIRQKR